MNRAERRFEARHKGRAASLRGRDVNFAFDHSTAMEDALAHMTAARPKRIKDRGKPPRVGDQ